MERLDMTLAEAGFATSLYFIFPYGGLLPRSLYLEKASAKSLSLLQRGVVHVVGKRDYLYSIRKQLFIFALLR